MTKQLTVMLVNREDLELLCVQTLESLKVLLDRDGVEYSTKTFDTDDGIAGLGDEPFVSLTSAQINGFYMVLLRCTGRPFTGNDTMTTV